jgi:biopolymer transport protein ExbD
MLAAMVDILVNILIFLLTLYGAGPEGLAAGVEVPAAGATAGDAPHEVAVTLGTDGIAVQGRTVVPLSGAPGAARLPADVVVGDTVQPLAEALRALAQKAVDPSGRHEAEVVIQVDRRLPWDVVGPVVATASEAGFAKVRFLVRTGD